MLEEKQHKSMSRKLPAGTLTHASCATASFAAELMDVLKEALIFLHSLKEMKMVSNRLYQDISMYNNNSGFRDFFIIKGSSN